MLGLFLGFFIGRGTVDASKAINEGFNGIEYVRIGKVEEGVAKEGEIMIKFQQNSVLVNKSIDRIRLMNQHAALAGHYADILKPEFKYVSEVRLFLKHLWLIWDGDANGAAYTAQAIVELDSWKIRRMDFE